MPKLIKAKGGNSNKYLILFIFTSTVSPSIASFQHSKLTLTQSERIDAKILYLSYSQEEKTFQGQFTVQHDPGILGSPDPRINMSASFQIQCLMMLRHDS
jgi:hypothetical protein